MSAQVRLLEQYRPQWSLLVDVEGDERRRERQPWRRLSPQPPAMWRDDAGLPPGLADALTAVLDRSDPLSSFGAEVEDGEYAGRFEQVTACWGLLVPHHPDLLAAVAHPRLHRARTRNRSGIEPLLDALGRSRRPLGPPAHSALLLGLGAHGGVERTHAVDAVLDLAAGNAIDGSTLGDTLATLLRAEAVVGTRVAAGLAEVFRADSSTSDVLVECIVAAQGAIEGRRDAHLYLDLLADAAIASGRSVQLSPAFEETARSSAKTQLARACRRVPQSAEDAT